MERSNGGSKMLENMRVKQKQVTRPPYWYSLPSSNPLGGVMKEYRKSNYKCREESLEVSQTRAHRSTSHRTKPNTSAHVQSLQAPQEAFNQCYGSQHLLAKLVAS